MNRSKPDALFELIHSLSKGEKKQFRIYARQNLKNESSQFLKLFDIYSGLSEYDAEKIRKQVLAGGFSRHFTSLRSKLSARILRYIRQSHTDSARQQIFELLSFSDILARKRLLTQQWDVLGKAAKLADETGLLSLSRYVIREQIAIQSRIRSKENPAEIRRKHEERLFHIERLLHIEQDLMIPVQQLGMLIGQGLPPKVTSIPEINAIRLKLDDLRKLYSDVPEAAPYLERADASLAVLDGQTEKALKHYRQLIRLLEKKPAAIVAAPAQWFYVCDMILHNLTSLSRFDEAEKEIERIRRFTRSHFKNQNRNDLQFHLLRITTCFALHLCISTGKYEEGCTIAENARNNPELITLLDAPEQHLFWYNSLVIFIASRKQKQALYCIRELEQPELKYIFQRLGFYTRLLSIIVHYELGNYEYVHSISRQLQRLVKKDPLPLHFENAFLNFARQYLDDRCDAEHFRKFRDENIHLLQPATQIQYFDFAAWLETHIRRVSFSQAQKNNRMQL